MRRATLDHDGLQEASDQIHRSWAATARRGASRVGHRALQIARRVACGAVPLGSNRRRPPDRWPVGTPWNDVAAAGLFDAAWYRRAYRDIEAGDDPMWHYATVGWMQGRDPNPLFSTLAYLADHADVSDARANPLVHYLLHGADEGRNPSPRFDTSWYLQNNPDVRSARVNPLGHYLTCGQAEGRRPVPLPSRPLADPSVRVVLVSGEPTTPGHRHRVERFADAVRAIGGSATTLTLPEAALARVGAIDQADVILLWRTAWVPETERVVNHARRAGAVVVFDIDDLMVDPDLALVKVVDGIRSQGLTEAEARDWFEQVGRTAREADACTCTTPALASALRPFGKPVHVLPNGYDDDLLVRSRLARRRRLLSPDDGLCRIGYATGSRTHQRDFALVASVISEVLRRHPEVRLVLYRTALDLDEFPEFDDLRGRIEWREIVPAHALPTELARFDVNLAPLEVGNPFCEAKSDLKFFEAALVEVPTIASPTEPHRAGIIDGVNGCLASTPDTWRDALTALIMDEHLRESIGRAARRSVLWDRGPDRRAQLVRSIIEQVLRADGGADAFELELSRASRPRASEPERSAYEVVVEYDRLRTSRVTVVVPLHDYAGFVTDALDSVREQTLADLDLVVVDDGSTDRSVDIVRGWMAGNAARFNRALLLAHSTNAGVAAARNAGFDIADTPYVLPLDADNVLLPRCCEALLEAVEGTSAAYAYPRIQHIGEDSELFPDGHVRGYLPYAPQRLVGSNYIDAMALVRTSAWSGAGGYRSGCSGWEDYDLWCRFAELGLHGVRVPEDLALYRVHRASMLHTVTHQAGNYDRIRSGIVREHPWLTPDGSPQPAPVSSQPRAVIPRPQEATGRSDVSGDVARTMPSGTLSGRARSLLPLMRCPVTFEPLVEDLDGGLRSTVTGRTWPVVNGRPNLFPGRERPDIMPAEHRGNPLPERALDLIAQARGPALHLSGGGTSADRDHVVELDASLYVATDVLGDAHRLPFGDEAFDLVLALNAFEHYREPEVVVREINRVLRPGGLVFIHTAFLQPLHEEPHHYFNCTRYGLEHWFAGFETIDLDVSDNFHPGFTLSWLASDAQEVLGREVSAGAVDAFRSTTMGTFSDFWRDPSTRTGDLRWEAFAQLSSGSRERLAAGFEYLGRRQA